MDDRQTHLRRTLWKRNDVVEQSHLSPLFGGFLFASITNWRIRHPVLTTRAVLLKSSLMLSSSVPFMLSETICGKLFSVSSHHLVSCYFGYDRCDHDLRNERISLYDVLYWMRNSPKRKVVSPINLNEAMWSHEFANTSSHR